jgi:uncharacterized damage-inducible protein DinB
MTKDDIQLLFEYDRWANDRILQAAAALTVEQFTRDLGGSFPSVRGAIVHIIAGEWIWLAYWKQPSHDSVFLAELRKRRETLFHPEVLPDLAAVRSKWAEVSTELGEFISGLTNEALGKTLPARDTQISLAHLMQHVANHSTYHRGQVTLMMRQLGAEPVATDFHVFLAEGRGRAS